ncbi:hypothetical protein [Deinococcus arenicola]|uniref:Lipoprotein n=1 Tax=Deinococcus arenicola TaxID=2994950 RepID=A0ABU4DP80_9DEIO|nr:hypothetical protein [Deinococcus sp. ZS9-10]MDV6374241.1 hypothetical protein [Deinococcus sp. ZS9-10]
MNRTVSALALSLTLLLASCAPATVQTGSGRATIPVLGGVGYSLSNRVALEDVTPQTPNNAAVTFTGCQGGAVEAQYVRQYGPDVALDACQQATQRASEINSGMRTASLVLLPVSIGVMYFFFRSLKCLTTIPQGCN